MKLRTTKQNTYPVDSDITLRIDGHSLEGDNGQLQGLLGYHLGEWIDVGILHLGHPIIHAGQLFPNFGVLGESVHDDHFELFVRYDFVLLHLIENVQRRSLLHDMRKEGRGNLAGGNKSTRRKDSHHRLVCFEVFMRPVLDHRRQGGVHKLCVPKTFHLLDVVEIFHGFYKLFLVVAILERLLIKVLFYTNNIFGFNTNACFVFLFARMEK